MRFLKHPFGDGRAANPLSEARLRSALSSADGGRWDLDFRSTLLSVAESSADVLALFDRQRKCVFLNRSIPGLTPDPWLGAPVEDFAPPEDRARVHDIFERVIHAGASEDFEQVFTDSAHKLRCLEMRVRAVQSGDRMLGAVVNITEVTEQRAQRDTLRTQARIIETMREGVVLVDAATMI